MNLNDYLPILLPNSRLVRTVGVPRPAADSPRRLRRPGCAVLGLDLQEWPRNEPGLFSREKPLGLTPILRFSSALSGVAQEAVHHHAEDDLPIVSASQMRTLRTVGPIGSLPRGLIRITHGWYTTRPLSTAQTVRALTHILPDDVVVAGETAALIYGVDVRPTSSYRTPFRLCVARPAGNRAIRRPGVLCRVLKFEDGDVISMHRVRCTSPLRTAIDLASSATIEIATHLIERFVQLGHFTMRQIEQRVSTMKGRRGVQTLRRAVALADPRSESVFETAVRIRLLEAGLLGFQPQKKVFIPGKINPYRLDLGFEDRSLGALLTVRVGLECDSDRYHPRSGPKAEADRLRREEIRARGWKIYSIRYSDLRGKFKTFEAVVARMLGFRLGSWERVPWHWSRWTAHRNAWVRGETLDLFVESNAA